MGLFGKIKDILFDEEEIEEEKEEKKTESKNIEKDNIVQTEYKPPVVHRPIEKKEIDYDDEPILKNSQDDFKVENAFPFPDFDEDEFDSVHPTKQKNTNVLEFERNKRLAKKFEHNRHEKEEVVEKKKFKPSPIISPVYGILNEDYVADDITNRGDPIPEKKNLNVEVVRKKAFGSIDEQPKKEVIEEKETVSNYEPDEEKQKKVKTIDELLEDTSDVKISIDDEELIANDDIEKEILPEKEELLDDTTDDNLENDLFDLIDSMYDKGEDSEL